jgi:hypothetical protein
MRKAALFLAILSLAACASQIMQSYVGKDIREAVMDYGPPVNAFDMPDGTRAFQWHEAVTYSSPTFVNTTGNLSGTTTGAGDFYSHNASLSSQAIVTPGIVNTEQCFYTLFARKGATEGAWTVTGFKKPRFACE